MAKKRVAQKRSWRRRAALWGAAGFGACVVISALLQAAGVLPSNEEFDATKTAEASIVVAAEVTNDATVENIPTDTPLPSDSPSETDVPSNTPVPVPSGGLLFSGDNVDYVFENVAFRTDVPGQNAGLYLVVLATLFNHADSRACIPASDIRLYLDNEEYRPPNGLMDNLKPVVGRDFTGAFTGQCVRTGESARTFTAFAIPDTWQTAELSYQDNRQVIELALPPAMAVALARTNIARSSDIPVSNTPTRMSTPTITPTSALAASRTPSLPPETTLYTRSGDTRARACPETTDTCRVLEVLTAGTQVTGIQLVSGTSVSGSTQWWQVEYLGREMYIHSSLLSTTRPVVQPQSLGGSTSSSGNTSTSGNTGAVAPAPQSRPGNCATAVAMGLTAQQAAQWDHLDRDNDGVACYGD